MGLIIPNLHNPTDVEFAQKNDAATRFDHRRRTPVNRVATDAKFSLKCQIKWTLSDAQASTVMTNVGLDDKEKGYVLVRTIDLKAKGKSITSIKAGDRITKLEKLDVLFYVLRTEPGSHYNGEFQLVQIYFHDRKGQDG